MGFFCALASSAISSSVGVTVVAAKQLNALQKKSALLPLIYAPVVLVIGTMIALANPAHDAWYYGIAIACLVGMVLTCLSAINYFNFLTTRPVPNFFSREGANNAKER